LHAVVPVTFVVLLPLRTHKNGEKVTFKKRKEQKFCPFGTLADGAI
jgi:hypothetical protein